MINNRLNIIKFLEDSVIRYESLCREDSAGEEGERRKNQLKKLIFEIKKNSRKIDLAKILEFYLKEKKSGWFEPRLTRCLRLALYTIFEIPSSFCVNCRHSSFFGRSLEKLDQTKQREEQLNQQINHYLESADSYRLCLKS